jgi:hypothetical protein
MLTYVLPIKAEEVASELTGYLAWLATRAEVIVVDGSDPATFAEHHRRWPTVRHLPVDPDLVTPMGKVGGVLTGLRHASHRKVVIADDDVRYGERELAAVEALLRDADVVRPQNFFTPLPWHARWDTARSLIARATGGDWPGTLGLDRDTVIRAGGYRGDVMFENLELVRTIAAAGGRFVDAPDLFVARRPPTSRQFWSQRIRQAYDELARPVRLAVALLLIPLVLVGGRRVALALAIGSIGLAEAGRRRHRGRTVYPWTSALWAPAWLTERAVTSWLAEGARARGGVRYGGTRLARAATHPRPAQHPPPAARCAHGRGRRARDPGRSRGVATVHGRADGEPWPRRREST